jgi:hypothetical protein
VDRRQRAHITATDRRHDVLHHRLVDRQPTVLDHHDRFELHVFGRTPPGLIAFLFRFHLLMTSVTLAKS